MTQVIGFGIPNAVVGAYMAQAAFSPGAAPVRIVSVASENRCPTAVIVADKAVIKGVIGAIAPSPTAPVRITFDGSKSSDPDGDSLTFDWRIGSQNYTGSSPSVDLTVGSYTATLIVNDGHCSATESVGIQVLSPAVAVKNVENTVDQSNLPRSTKVSLSAPLGAAAHSFENGQIISANHQLNSFKLQVTVKTDSSTANSLITLTNQIIDATAGATGDLNGDGKIDQADASILSSILASGSVNLNYDVNLDGRLDARDLEALIGQFTNSGGLP